MSALFINAARIVCNWVDTTLNTDISIRLNSSKQPAYCIPINIFPHYFFLIEHRRKFVYTPSTTLRQTCKYVADQTKIHSFTTISDNTKKTHCFSQIFRSFGFPSTCKFCFDTFTICICLCRPLNRTLPAGPDGAQPKWKLSACVIVR